jgi:hypothetical protein
VLGALDKAGGVSCYHYVSSLRFRDNRARNECLQLALFIDAYLEMEVDGLGLPLDSELLDLMCRRLIGVLNADETGNWSMAAASQKSGISRMAGNDLFVQLSRAANAHDRLQKAVTKVGSSGAGGARRGGAKPRGKRGGRSRKAGSPPASVSGAAARSAATSRE